MADLVLNMRDQRPIWAIPEWAVAELRRALPEGWTMHVAHDSTGGAGDGDGVPGADVLEALRGARVYLGFGIPESVLEAGGVSLGWVHSGAAGVGSSLHAPMLESRVRFTNSAGIHGPPIAETVVGMLLYFARGFDFALAGSEARSWNDTPFLAADTPVREVGEMTVGVLGFGGIGREVGARLSRLGSRVLGHRRTPTGPGDATDGVTLLHGEGGLERLLDESDALVLAAPLTDETRGILGEKRLRRLRRGSVVINVGRGALIDEEALIAALRDGHLRGAGLDVFAQEPLPVESELWQLPNVLVTPHVSAVTRGFWRRELDLILENLGRFADGKPLLNEVRRDRGY